MDEFSKKYLNKKIAILGLGLSGLAALKYFNKNKMQVRLWDDCVNVRNSKKISKKYILDLNLEKNIKQIDILFVSPGIPFNHMGILLARKLKKQIISDIDIFWKKEAYNNNVYVAVTGSNGKSTVTSLINYLLNKSNLSSKMAGNIGVPVLEVKSFDREGIFVLELSSYQLNWVNDFKANLSVLTNLSHDHVESHGSMENYILAKKKIFNNQKSDDVAIINIDNEYCFQIYKRLKDRENGPKIIAISENKRVKNSVFFSDDVLIDYTGNSEIEIGKINELSKLKGHHNRENIACAIAVCLTLSVSHQSIIKHLPNFIGLPHRLEEICSYKNVTFINDSKSTNLNSSKAAIKSFSKVIWIAGGLDKKENLNLIARLSKNIEAGFFIGDSGEKFKNFYKNFFCVENCVTLKQAISDAISFAIQYRKQIVILFSPGCASFDQFSNFEKRGEVYKHQVLQTIKKLSEFS